MKYNIVSFLEHYSEIFTEEGLQVLTGLSQQEIDSYRTGKSQPNAEKLKEIEKPFINSVKNY